jgi:hypothetical protein
MKTASELKQKLRELESEQPTNQRDRLLNATLIGAIRSQLALIGDPDFCQAEADRIIRNVWG